MTLTSKAWVLAAAILSTSVGISVSRVRAWALNGDSAVSEGCTDATLNGTYGFQRNGTTSQGPLTATGIIEFDGQGNSVARQTISRSGVFSGVPIDSAASQSPTYIVYPDCTGEQIDVAGNPVGSFVIVHNGAEILGMSLTAGNNVAIHFERIVDPSGNAPANPGRQ